jgi:hypothetical protein
MHTGFLLEDLNMWNHLKDPGVDGGIIVKWINVAQEDRSNCYNAITNLLFSQKAEIFLTTWRAVKVSIPLGYFAVIGCVMSNILRSNSDLIFNGHISNEKASWKVVCPSEAMVLTYQTTPWQNPKVYNIIWVWLKIYIQGILMNV